MASGTANAPGPMVAGPETNLQHDQFIEHQLARTRRRVKWVDLGSITMGLVGAVIAYLMIVVVVDHWIADLGRVGRVVALLVLVLGVAYCVAAFLVPPFLRRINPAYAARAIEQSDPSLKNSLINFLMFRRDPTPTNRLVYQALRQRAALDLRHVNIDLAVDRTRLIHVGYMVVVLMALFAVYTIFSPKDVFRTMLRVAAPWADLARPARVSISDVRVQRGTDVQPSSAPMTLIYGDRPTISARIQGVRADETATLYFSTADKQIVDRAVPMECPEDGQRYHCTIPPDPAGLRQSVTYWIEAGDARSSEFNLNVSDAPTILVESVTYDYPTYTLLEQRVVAKDGEVQALEGTRVTIQACANHPIKDARIEFNPDPARPPVENDGVLMEFDGTVATYGFYLQLLSSDRQTPEYTSYRLSFTATNGLHSADPMIYRILVSRDLPPEIAVLTPRNADIELAANNTQHIEIRALDPDFGLSSVVLRARCNGKVLVDENLLKSSSSGTAPETVTYDFSPSKWDLAPGDKVTYWAEAADNRTSNNGAPEPNLARTADQFITIVGPPPSEAPSEDSASAEQRGQEAPQQDSGGQGEPAATNQQSTDQGDSTDSPKPSDQGDPEDSGASEQPKPGEEGSQAKQPQSGDSEQGEQEQQGDQGQQGAQGQSGQQQSGTPQSGQQGAPEQADQGGQSQQESASSDGVSGEPQPGEQGMSQGAPGEQSPAPSAGAGGDPTSNGTQQPTPGTGTPPSGAGVRSGGDAASDDGQSGQERGGAPGQNAESLHDGEAIERVMQHFRESANAATQGSHDPLAKPDPDDAVQESDLPPDATPNPANPAKSSSESGGGDDAQQPGVAAPMAAGGQGENSDPRDGAGEVPTAPRTPKNAEGPEESQNPDTGPLEREGGVSDEGQAGSGESSDSPEGAPSSEAKKLNRDRDKPNKDPDRDKGTKPDDTAPQAPSMSRKQSDSQGDVGGDESGGGEQGGGQSANQAGRDSPGSNMSSENGNVGSPESGSGETADRAGDKQLAPEATGQSGQTPGSGTQTVNTPQGQDLTQQGAPPHDPSRQPDAGQKTQDSQPQPAEPQQNDSRGGTNSGPVQGGGLPADDVPSAPQTEPEVLPEADAANLEYARKATDLVLERLKDQQQDPDLELLKSLGWTKEELQQFITRWEELERAAREEGPAAQANLDDALRSLGLRATNAERRRGDSTNDQAGGQHELGRSSLPPAEFLEQFKAYKKGKARGPSDGGAHRP